MPSSRCCMFWARLRYAGSASHSLALAASFCRIHTPDFARLSPPHSAGVATTLRTPVCCPKLLADKRKGVPSGVPILSTGPEPPPISGRGSTSATDAQPGKTKPMKVVLILENPGKNIVVNVTTGGYQPYAFSSN